MGILFANALVGTMTTLALILLFWPLVSARLEPPARALA